MNKYIALILIALAILVALIFGIKSVDRIETPSDNVAGESSTPSDDTPLDVAGDPSGSLGPCYIGGCSSQVCSDEEGVSSTCEFREEYACYRTAKCERQATGQCGWTETSELSMCLNSSRQ